MDYEIINPHLKNIESNFELAKSGPLGLTCAQAEERLKTLGLNQLPSACPPTLLSVFARQFTNPLIYILLIVSAISLLLGHSSDSGFIFAILFMNAALGTYQEYNAEKGALALRQMSKTKVIVERDGENYEVDSQSIVVGDLILLESGTKVPADLRLWPTCKRIAACFRRIRRSATGA